MSTPSRRLDIAGINPYHPTQDLYDGEGSSYGGDFARSLKGTNYLVTEINAQTIGWDSRSQFPPNDGQLRQDVYLIAATGANMVEYWHWHSLHYGQETCWKGVLSHDLEPGRVYGEVARTAARCWRIFRWPMAALLAWNPGARPSWSRMSHSNLKTWNSGRAENCPHCREIRVHA
jgi:beta-galactosidase